MARRSRRNKTEKRLSRFDLVDARADALRSFLGFKPDFTLAERRRVPYVPPVTEGYSQPLKKAPARVQILKKPSSDSARTQVDVRAYQGRLSDTVLHQALVCAKRSARKEVLHALGKTGKSGQKKPRFNENSSIRC